MRTITVHDFQAELIAQGVPTHLYFAFKCPMCETLQTAADLIDAGAGATFDDVEKYLAFSCIGRWRGVKLERDSKGKGKGCDWTLGGLFKTHKLEVISAGVFHPRFEPATPQEAQSHHAIRMSKAARDAILNALVQQ